MFPAPFVVVGLGQLGTLFAEGFLRLGHPVVPVLRKSERIRLASEIPTPGLVLVAVGEDDLPGQLATLPPAWRSRVALVQNELRPADYSALPAPPSVAVVWFERKAGLPPKEVRPTVVSGPEAEVLEKALSFWPLEIVSVDRTRLPFELALKNLYILALNLAGLAHPGTVGALLDDHGSYFWEVAAELADLERALNPEAHFSNDDLFRDLAQALHRDLAHGTSGRSAPRRLARTVELARRVQLKAPRLEELALRFLKT